MLRGALIANCCRSLGCRHSSDTPAPARQRRRWAQCEHDREANDCGACPRGKLIDIERRPVGQEVYPGGHGGQLVPVELGEQCQPHFGENTRLGDATLIQDPFACAHHVRCRWILACQLECEVNLDRRVQISWSAPPLRPVALRLLVVPQVACDLRPLLGIADAEVVGEQQILRCDRGVGLQFAPPVSRLCLIVKEPVARSRNGIAELC